MHKKQSGGSGQFADVAIKFEPGEPGSGFEFRSEIKGGVVPKEYIPGVLKVGKGSRRAGCHCLQAQGALQLMHIDCTQGLEEMMTSGSLAGFPVVDVRATLVDGSYHDVDSSVLAFQIAARQAFRFARHCAAGCCLDDTALDARRDGMKKAGVQLLEPIMKVEVVTPEEHMGDVIGDLNSRRGIVQEFTDKPGGMKV